MSHNSKTDIKIKILIEKLEKETGKKITLEEVRRKPVASLRETVSVVKDLLKKNGLSNSTKITIQGNNVKIDNTKKNNSFSLKSVGFGLQEEGFSMKSIVTINNKNYNKFVDRTKRFVVLIQEV